MKGFFCYCEDCFRADADGTGVIVFQNVGYLLCFLYESGLSTRVLWKWVEKWTRESDAATKTAFQIGFLEDVVDPPVVREHMEWLWCHWHDPNTKWMVEAAYSRRPSRLRKDKKLFGGIV